MPDNGCGSLSWGVPLCLALVLPPLLACNTHHSAPTPVPRGIPSLLSSQCALIPTVSRETGICLAFAIVMSVLNKSVVFCKRLSEVPGAEQELLSQLARLI